MVMVMVIVVVMVMVIIACNIHYVSAGRKKHAETLLKSYAVFLRKENEHESNESK